MFSYTGFSRCLIGRAGDGCYAASHCSMDGRIGCIMGKYLLGWLLGVPAIVLLVIYLFMH